MDCNTALPVKVSSSIPLRVIPYSTSPTFSYLNGFNDVFSNIGESKGCPINECLLMESTCSTTLLVDSVFFIAKSTPWGLTAQSNNVDGWNEIAFCYKCSGLA